MITSNVEINTHLHNHTIRDFVAQCVQNDLLVDSDGLRAWGGGLVNHTLALRAAGSWAGY
jgi:hypothetical protein